MVLHIAVCVCVFKKCYCETAGWELSSREALLVNLTEHVSFSESRCGTSVLGKSHLTDWKRESARGAKKQNAAQSSAAGRDAANQTEDNNRHNVKYTRLEERKRIINVC